MADVRDDGIEILGAGVVIAPQAAADEPDDDFFTPEDSVEELLARAVLTRRRGHPKAAMAALVDAVNTMADEHGIGGGAWL